MKPYAQQAAEIHLAFRAGLVEIPAIIQWADSVLASLDRYDDDLAEISLAANRSPQDIDSMLLHASDGVDRIQTMRNLLIQMHEAMLRDRGQAMDFARVLAYIETTSKVPQDLHFIGGLDSGVILEARKQVLLQSRGGTTDETCIWSGCGGKRVKGVAYCLEHLWNTGARR